MKKLVLMSVMATLLFTGCITKKGSRAWFEARAQLGQRYMDAYLSSDIKDELKNPPHDFVYNYNWYNCMKANGMEYNYERWNVDYLIPDQPYEIWDSTKLKTNMHCVETSIVACWNYGWDNLLAFGVMGDSKDEQMHQVSFFNVGGKVLCISNDTNWTISSRERFYEIFNGYEGFDHFNLYDKNFKHEYDLSEGHKLGLWSE